MDTVNIQHKDLADGRWSAVSFPMQMANIGSEVSRAIKWREKGRLDRMEQACIRALELFDLTLESCCNDSLKRQRGRLKELCRAREEFCDFFYGSNEFNTDLARLQRYYDQFALMKEKGTR